MTPTNFDDFMQRRAAAAKAYVRGDAEPVVALTVQREPASFLGPDGSVQHGVAAVVEDFRRGAGHFGPDSDCRLEVVHQHAGDDAAFWTGYQIADVQMKDSGEKVAMKLRITEVFRREDGAWRLAHRHADRAK